MDLTPDDEMEQEFIGTPEGEAWLDVVDQIRDGQRDDRNAYGVFALPAPELLRT